MESTLVASRVGLVSLVLVLLWRLVRRSKFRHPPSPTSFAFIGNLFSIPPGHEYIAFAKLGEELKSDTIFLKIFGQKIIVINSAETASEILDKRSAFHSDRPRIPMVADVSLMNWSRVPSLIEYSDIWRQYRQIMNSWLNKRAVTQFDNLQERQTRSLLQRLSRATQYTLPFEQVRKEFFFAMGSLMLQLAYGYKPRDPQDPFLMEAQLAIHNILSAAMQTRFFVNVFPSLSYIPEWFPGTGWKRIGREWGFQQEKAKTGPYEWLKSQIAAGVHHHSLLGPFLQDHQLLSGLGSNERDERLKEVGIVLFAGGTDTIANFLVSFVAAMILNPHAQARAQQELDTVVGYLTLPRISDRERLPYTRGLIDEVFRLYPVVPLGIPHSCYRDDTYRNYDIQKGTTIMGNIWAMGRDPRHYSDPEKFNPDRYLDPQIIRPPVFGWGRRKCPGSHFAGTSAFIAVASLLATFTFSKKRDRNGEDIVPQIDAEPSSMIFALKPFDFEFRTRSEEHLKLILKKTGIAGEMRAFDNENVE